LLESGAQLRGFAGQQFDGLVDIPPAGRRRHLEPCRDLPERLALAQIHQDQQRLLGAVKATPPRPAGLAVVADEPGHEGEGLA
jgi:hypothetical protein